MKIQLRKGQFWKHENQGHVWVRFIFETDTEGTTPHYLEYSPNGVVPNRGSDKMEIDEDDDFPYWTEIGVQEAQAIIQNMPAQDDAYAYRLGHRVAHQNLAKALKILEGKKVSSVDVRENVVRVSTSNGAEYEIAIDREGYTSRQTGLPDPW